MKRFTILLFLILTSQFTQAQIPSTNGSGGIQCEHLFTTVKKIPYCKTMIGKNEVRMVIPKGAGVAGAPPVQLAVFLHWDYSKFWEQEWEEYMSFAYQNNILFVRVLSANKKYWWRSLWRSDYDFSHVGHLANVLHTLGAKYNLYKEEILYSGMSGGSTFLTSMFLPLMGPEFPGVYVMNCGGVTPKKTLVLAWTDELKSKFHLYYKFYAKEKIFGNAINDSIAWYNKNGFTTSFEKVPTNTYQHCEPEVGDKYQDFWVRPTIQKWSEHLISDKDQ